MTERSALYGLLRTAILALALASPAAAQAKPDTTHPPYSAADVRFMTGMIYHHAQAVLIAGWAKSHGAGPSVQTLCDRIVVSQRDEITRMDRWLAARKLPVPDLAANHDMMPGMQPGTMMPGMLTADQLAQLDRARGQDFDELFLTFMIQHHKGALVMVDELFAQGAGEETTVFKFASGVYADQTTEITRMQKMLAAEVFGPAGH